MRVFALAPSWDPKRRVCAIVSSDVVVRHPSSRRRARVPPLSCSWTRQRRGRAHRATSVCREQRADCENCCHRRPSFRPVIVDKPHHAELSGFRGSANGHVISRSAWPGPQSFCGNSSSVCLSTKFSREARGDPLNAVSITASSRSRDSAGYRKQRAGAERFRPVIDGRLDGSAGAGQLRRTH
jgi:hypothetical protein